MHAQQVSILEDSKQYSSTAHWNRIYKSKAINQLGWYENRPEQCLELLSRCQLSPDDPVLDVGVGTSAFIDCLIELGYKNIYALDISEEALLGLKDRLGKDKASRVHWIVEDIVRPALLAKLTKIGLWHDRALLHFLLSPEERQIYLDTLKKVLRPNGYVIIAAFAIDGAKMCSGLNVRNYDEQILASFLGDSFRMVDHYNYTYTQPSGGKRPYIYTLFQRIEADFL